MIISAQYSKRANLFLTIVFLFLILPIQNIKQQENDLIILENVYLTVELLRTHPYVHRYVFNENEAELYGDLVNETFFSYIYYQNNFYAIEPRVNSIREEGNKVCYLLNNNVNSVLAVTYELCYLLNGFQVLIEFGKVKETSNYKLIYVRSPDLVTVRADQEGSKLVFPFAEGRLIDVATSSATGSDAVTLDSTGWTRPLQAGMIYYPGLLGVVSYDHLDMEMYESIVDHPIQGRIGSIGMVFNYRYAPTNFETATFVNVFDEITTSLSLTISFFSNYDRDLDLDWMDGAKYLRDQVNATPEPLYLESFITKIGRNGIDHITDHLNTIERLYHLTDHTKIHAYMLDYNWILFQVYGNEQDLDPEFANLADLVDVFEIADQKFNTSFGFHDNFRDYYEGAPTYDPTLRLVQGDGSLAQGWSNDNFPAAYALDIYDYAIAEGLARVDQVLSTYPITESHHIDVLGVVYDMDFSIDSPTSREKNRRGTQLIIDQFDSYGVDVTTEVLTGPYVESGIGWFLDVPRVIESDFLFSDSEFIPLIEFIFHGKTLYGLFDDAYYAYPNTLPQEEIEIYAFLEPLLLGANSAAHITWSEPNDLELDKFYLIDLPWMALNQRFMNDYIAEGSYRKITYNESTYVEIDYDQNAYTVLVDGHVIGKDYTTIYPKDESTFLIYSRNAKSISIPLPETWGQSLELWLLAQDGNHAPTSFVISGDTVTFDVQAAAPYKLVKLDESQNIEQTVSPEPTQEIFPSIEEDAPIDETSSSDTTTEISISLLYWALVIVFAVIVFFGLLRLWKKS